jgi:ubiquitin carboxyl-terminal hydrolase 14
MFAVKVKWGKNTYSDIDLNTDEDPLLFKAQIFALTGVQPDRQKVMLKGAQLKDDGWGTLPVKGVIKTCSIYLRGVILIFLRAPPS